MIQLQKTYIIPLIILSIFLLMGFTYSNTPFNNDDQKKLEKAQALNQEAQKLIDKANSLYSEIAAFDDSDSQNTEKIEKLKNKALDYQINALELQKEANFIEYNVLIKNITNLKEKYSLNTEIPIELKLKEEQSGESFYKAEKLRNEAYKLDDNDLNMRYSKLSDAQEFERSGIENLRQLKEIFSGNQQIEKKEYSITDTIVNEQNIEINEELLQAFLKYINQKDSFLTINSYYNILYSDSLSSSSIRKIWDNYLYSDIGGDFTDEYKEIKKDSLTDENDLRDITAEIIKEDVGESNSNVYRDVLFKIEIAADKKPLPQHTLQKIYAGNKTIEMVNDDGWYKYTIEDFKTYQEANLFRLSLKVDNAFVVAYKDGAKVDLADLGKAQKEKSNKIASISIVTEGLIFKVQIAAAKVKLTENELAEIYKGNETIDMNEVDGWYKYSIGKLNTYEQAAELNKSTQVAGSFVVAYKDGVKVSLISARKGILSETRTNGNIVFKVQIAADKSQLSSEKLHELYSGFEKINKYEEDGWYKYSVGEFSSFSEANEFRKKCNVKGAFVIAFKNDKKINVLEAKKAMICYDPIIQKEWITSNTDLVFKVQIVASSEEISKNTLKKICCIEPNVYLIEENGWFKYSIGDFKLYQKAVNLKNISGVDGAFVVAYMNGQKLQINEAIKLSKK